jgi:hypothetical protein
MTARFIEPMLLLRTEKLPDGPGWCHELKFRIYAPDGIYAPDRNWVPRFPPQVSPRAKNDPQIDKDLQWQFSRGQIGVNMYSVRHRNYNDTMFEVLMSGGSSFRASRR